MRCEVCLWLKPMIWLRHGDSDRKKPVGCEAMEKAILRINNDKNMKTCSGPDEDSSSVKLLDEHWVVVIQLLHDFHQTALLLNILACGGHWWAVWLLLGRLRSTGLLDGGIQSGILALARSLCRLLWI